MPNCPQPLVIGQHPNGTSVAYDPVLHGHLVVAGTGGGGKTEVLRVMSSAKLEQDEALFVFDMSSGGKAFDFVRGRASGLAVGLEAAASLADALTTEVQRRRELAATHGVESIHDLPEKMRPKQMLVIFHDTEYLADWRAKDNAEQSKRDRVDQALTLLLNEGRATGAQAVLSIQDLDHLEYVESMARLFDSQLLLGRPRVSALGAVFSRDDMDSIMDTPGDGRFTRPTAGDIARALVHLEDMASISGGPGVGFFNTNESAKPVEVLCRQLS